MFTLFLVKLVVIIEILIRYIKESDEYYLSNIFLRNQIKKNKKSDNRKLPLELVEGQDVYVKKGMVRAEFNFWVGIPMDKFYEGLEQKKFVGNKCPECGKVFCPPRKICGDCFVEAKEFIDLPETGVLKNYTITNYKVNERGTRQVKKDMIAGLVQIDGADTAMFVPLENVEPDQLKEDMKVKVIWAKRIKGVPDDIKGFEPA